MRFPINQKAGPIKAGFRYGFIHRKPDRVQGILRQGDIFSGFPGEPLIQRQILVRYGVIFLADIFFPAPVDTLPLEGIPDLGDLPGPKGKCFHKGLLAAAKPGSSMPSIMLLPGSAGLKRRREEDSSPKTNVQVPCRGRTPGGSSTPSIILLPGAPSCSGKKGEGYMKSRRSNPCSVVC